MLLLSCFSSEFNSVFLFEVNFIKLRISPLLRISKVLSDITPAFFGLSRSSRFTPIVIERSWRALLIVSSMSFFNSSKPPSSYIV